MNGRRSGTSDWRSSSRIRPLTAWCAYAFVLFIPTLKAYLSHHGFVHRDLAARNVLVKKDVAKVLVKKRSQLVKQPADLGLWPVSSRKRSGRQS